jgi:hypothetical protein
MVQEFLKVAGGHAAVFVRPTVIDKQRALDHDGATRETAAVVETLELIIRFRLQ